MERLRVALAGDLEKGVPPVSIPAYLIACAVGVFVGTLCYFGLNLAMPVGTATLPNEPGFFEHLPNRVGGLFFMATITTVVLMFPVAVIAAPVVLPLLVRLKRQGLLSRGAAAGFGAAAAIVAVVVPLLVVAVVDSDPLMARISPIGGMLAAPSGAAAGLTYRALLARLMKVSRPM